MGEEEKKEDAVVARCLVYVRLRPTKALDSIGKDGVYQLVNCNKKIIKLGDEKTYEFDGSFTPANTQEEIFNEVAKPSLEHVLKGFTSAIMCYGQTGTGKSYTMSHKVPGQEAIIPRSANYLFEKINAQNSKEFTLSAHFVQIYRDSLSDLMVDPKEKQKVDIRYQEKSGVEITNCTEVPVTSTAQFMEMYEQGDARRVVRPTKMNPDSSRGHTALVLYVKSKSIDPDDMSKPTAGKITFIDLAGYERFEKTGLKDPVHIDEAKKINASLLALGYVVTALSNGDKHVPWRNAKLTRLLQDSIGGKSRSTIVITCGPASTNLHETTNSMDFGNRAMAVKVSAKVEVDVDYQKLAAKLQKQLEEQAEKLDKLELAEKTREVEKAATLSRHKADMERVRNRHKEELGKLLEEGATAERIQKLIEMQDVETETLQDMQNDENDVQEENFNREKDEIVKEEMETRVQRVRIRASSMRKQITDDKRKELHAAYTLIAQLRAGSEDLPDDETLKKIHDEVTGLAGSAKTPQLANLLMGSAEPPAGGLNIEGAQTVADPGDADTDASSPCPSPRAVTNAEIGELKQELDDMKKKLAETEAKGKESIDKMKAAHLKAAGKLKEERERNKQLLETTVGLEKLEAIEGELHEVKDAKKEAERMLGESQERVAKLEENLNGMSARVWQTQVESKKREAQIEALTAEKEELDEKMSLLEQEKSELEEEFNRKKREVEIKAEEADAAGARAQGELRGEVDVLKETVAARDASLVEAQKKYEEDTAALQTKVEETTKELDAARTRHAEEADALKSKVDAAEAAAAASNQDLEAGKTALAQEKEALEASMSKRGAELDQLATQAQDEAGTVRRELQKQIEDIQAKCSLEVITLKEQVEKLTADIAALNVQLAADGDKQREAAATAAEKETAAAAALAALREETAAKIAELEAQNATLTSEGTAAKEELEAKAAAQGERIEALEASEAALKEDVVQKEEGMATLKVEGEETKAALQAAEAEGEKTKQALERAEEKVGDLEKQVEKLEASAGDSGEREKLLIEEKMQANENMKQVLAEKAGVQEKLDAEVEVHRALQEASAAEITTLKTENEGLAAAVEAEKAAKEAAATEAEELRGKLDAETAAHGEAREARDAVTSERDELTAKVATLEAQGGESAEAVAKLQDDLAAAQEQAKDVNGKLDELTAAHTELKDTSTAQAAALTDERDALATELAESKAAHDALQNTSSTERETLEAAAAAANDKITALTAELDAAKAEHAEAKNTDTAAIKTLTDEKAALTARVEELEGEKQAVAAEREALTASLEAAKTEGASTTEAKDALAVEKAELEAKIAELTTATEAGSGREATLAEEKAAVEKELETAQAENEKLAGDIDAGLEREEKQGADIDALTQKVAGLEGDVAAAKTAHDEDKAKLTEEKHALETQLAALQGKVEALESATTDSAERENALSAEKGTLLQKVEGLEGELEAARAKQGEADEALAASKAREAELTEQLDAAAKEKDAAGQASTEEIEGLKASLAAAEAALETQKADGTAKEAQLQEDVEKSRADAAAKEAELTGQLEEVKTATAAKEEELTAQVDALKEDLEAAKADAGAKEAELAKEVEELKDEVDKLEGEVDEAGKREADLTAELETLKGGKAAVETELAEVKEKLAGTEADAADAKADLQAQIDELKAQGEEHAARIKEQEDEIDKLDADNNENMDKLLESEKQMQALTEEKLDVQKQLEDLRKARDEDKEAHTTVVGEKDAEISIYKEKTAELEDQLDQTKADLEDEKEMGAELAEDKEALQLELDEYKDQSEAALREKEDEEEKLKTNIASLEDELANSAQYQEALETRIKELEEQLVALQGDLKQEKSKAQLEAEDAKKKMMEERKLRDEEAQRLKEQNEQAAQDAAKMREQAARDAEEMERRLAEEKKKIGGSKYKYQSKVISQLERVGQFAIPRDAPPLARPEGLLVSLDPEEVKAAVRYSLVVVGGHHSGKSSVQHCLVKGSHGLVRRAPDTVSPTTNFDITPTVHKESRGTGGFLGAKKGMQNTTYFNVWDTPCDLRHLAALPPGTLPVLGCCYVLTFVLTNDFAEETQRLEEVLQTVWANAKEQIEEGMRLPVLLLGTRRDLLTSKDNVIVMKKIGEAKRWLKESTVNRERFQLIDCFAVSCKEWSVQGDTGLKTGISSFTQLMGYLSSEMGNRYPITPPALLRDVEAAGQPTDIHDWWMGVQGVAARDDKQATQRAAHKAVVSTLLHFNRLRLRGVWLVGQVEFESTVFDHIPSHVESAQPFLKVQIKKLMRQWGLTYPVLDRTQGDAREGVMVTNVGVLMNYCAALLLPAVYLGNCQTYAEREKPGYLKNVLAKHARFNVEEVWRPDWQLMFDGHIPPSSAPNILKTTRAFEKDQRLGVQFLSLLDMSFKVKSKEDEEEYDFMPAMAIRSLSNTLVSMLLACFTKAGGWMANTTKCEPLSYAEISAVQAKIHALNPDSVRLWGNGAVVHHGGAWGFVRITSTHVVVCSEGKDAPLLGTLKEIVASTATKALITDASWKDGMNLDNLPRLAPAYAKQVEDAASTDAFLGALSKEVLRGVPYPDAAMDKDSRRRAGR